MTSTDSLAEACSERSAAVAAEIERLTAQVAALREAEFEATVTLKARDLAAWDEIRHLRARITELEAIVTLGHGTMGTLQQPTPDEPATITHGHPPSAPPHDER